MVHRMSACDDTIMKNGHGKNGKVHGKPLKLATSAVVLYPSMVNALTWLLHCFKACMYWTDSHRHSLYCHGHTFSWPHPFPFCVAGRCVGALSLYWRFDTFRPFQWSTPFQSIPAFVLPHSLNYFPNHLSICSFMHACGQYNPQQMAANTCNKTPT